MREISEKNHYCNICKQEYVEFFRKEYSYQWHLYDNKCKGDIKARRSLFNTFIAMTRTTGFWYITRIYNL